MCCSRDSTYLSFFRAFLSLFRRDRRADVYQAVAKEKKENKAGWDFFLRRLSCGFGEISYNVGFNDLALFSIVLHVKAGKFDFYKRPDAAPVDSLPDRRKILNSVAYVASVFLLSTPNGWSVSVKSNDIFAGLTSKAP